MVGALKPRVPRLLNGVWSKLPLKHHRPPKHHEAQKYFWTTLQHYHRNSPFKHQRTPFILKATLKDVFCGVWRVFSWVFWQIFLGGSVLYQTHVVIRDVWQCMSNEFHRQVSLDDQTIIEYAMVWWWIQRHMGVAWWIGWRSVASGCRSFSGGETRWYITDYTTRIDIKLWGLRGLGLGLGPTFCFS
jgi:hypothetical protein